MHFGYVCGLLVVLGALRVGRGLWNLLARQRAVEAAGW